MQTLNTEWDPQSRIVKAAHVDPKILYLHMSKLKREG